MSIIDAALNRSRMVLAILFFLLIAGMYAYSNIPKESDPDVNIPIVYVSMNLEGISPEDAERLLVRPMEKEVKSIEGVKEMRSTAYDGGANVLLEFEAGYDIDLALVDVREKVDVAKANLPNDVDEPTVNEVNLSLFPILVVSLYGNVPERALLQYAKNLQDIIEEIPTVLEANITGERDETVEVLIDPVRLESYNLQPSDIAAKLNSDNQLVAAGAVDTGAGRFSIKVPGVFENITDIMEMPIFANGEGVVRFRDIAEVRRTFSDPSTFARFNGQQALAIEVSKRVGTNIIETIEQVQARVNAEIENWPSNIQVEFSQDKSNDIRTMLNDLQNNVITAVLLVMIVVVGAIGLRSGILVGIAIPGSFLTALLVLYLFGFTINVVVLFSLILAVGMLVDGAIVVTEYADRKISEGESSNLAYGLAAKRMAWPIIASTATTLSAFMPLLFWPGIVGEFMKFLPLTLIITLSASLAMALIFLPTLGSVLSFKRKPQLAGAGDGQSEAAPILAADQHPKLEQLLALKGGVGVYLRALNKCLNFPPLILLLALSLLIGSWVSYAKFGKGSEFFPAIEPEQLLIYVHARGNMSVAERDQLVLDVEDIIYAYNDDYNAFKSVNSASGIFEVRDEEAEDIIGKIQIELQEWDQRPSAVEIKQFLRERTKSLAGIYVEVKEPEAGPPTGKPVQIQLSSANPDLLEVPAGLIRAKMDQMPDLIDVEDSRPIPAIEWRLSVNRDQATKFDVDIATLSGFVQMVTRGVKIDSYRPNDSDEEVDILLRLPEEDRTLGRLDQIRILTPEGPVPVSNFLTRIPEQKTGILRRVDAERIMTIKAETVAGALPENSVKELQTWLDDQDFADDINIIFGGEDEEQAAASQFLGRAFMVALFLIAVILVTQFNSFYATFLILSAIIMSTVGVLIGLLITDKPFGIVMSGIGVIALAGIVVNNNIILIDTYNRLYKELKDRRTAILLTCAQRIRPVLLTTTTTILGLLPMTLQLNIDFIAREVSHGAPSTQWWVSLSTAIVFGLGFATILTLVVTPSLLKLPDSFRTLLAVIITRSFLKRFGFARRFQTAKPSNSTA
ncbi:MAG: efflux RND transporter permease subunit [Alphaproteobacteria bacterium]